MLSDISQTQKDKYFVIHLPEASGGVRSVGTGSRWWGPEAGEGMGSECFLGTEVQFGRWRNSGGGCGDGCMSM